MKRLTFLALVGLLSVAIASPALATDLPRPSYKAPLYVAPFSWSGFYVGINGGYGWGTSNWSSVATAGRTNPKGMLAGVTLGYNLQTGAWVWGLEGDFDYSWIKGTDHSGIGNCSGIGCETKLPWLATGRARFGYAWGSWLPYITGGAAYGQIKMTPNNGATTSQSKLGWTFGAGAEYAFLGAWSAKLEYLYVDLGNATCSAGAICGIVDTKVSFKTNIVRAGLNYRF